MCDVLEPWAHGTVVRATRYPDYYDYNVLRVEEADEALARELRRRDSEDVRDLWIVGDDEGRPKQLYTRLGFRPAWIALEALKLPRA